MDKHSEAYKNQKFQKEVQYYSKEAYKIAIPLLFFEEMVKEGIGIHSINRVMATVEKKLEEK